MRLKVSSTRVESGIRLRGNFIAKDCNREDNVCETGVNINTVTLAIRDRTEPFKRFPNVRHEITALKHGANEIATANCTNSDTNCAKLAAPSAH